MQPNPREALRRAIDVAGGLAKLGRMIDCSIQQVWNWTVSGRAPVSACPKIEAATGVPCEELRPDINWAYMREQMRSLSERSTNAQRTLNDNGSER